MDINYNFLQLNDICSQLKVKISHIYHRTLDTDWHFDRHSGNFNRLYFVFGGHGYLYNDKERVELEPYNTYLIPANSVYNYRCDGHLEKIFIHFSMTVIPNRDVFSGLDKIITVPGTREELEGIKEMFYKEDIYSAMYCENLIRNISFEILKKHRGNMDNDIRLYRKYKELYKYIESNLSARLSVAEVSKNVGYSQTYIGRQFKADTGQTIKEYITELLTEQMKNMLRRNCPLQQAADELGFSDISYCSKFFTKHMGITPREYVRKHVYHVREHKTETPGDNKNISGTIKPAP